MKKPRPLPQLIKNFRVLGKVDWHNLNNTIEACANETLKRGYLYFGLQFYGECWSGPRAHSTYDRDNSSERCWRGVGKGRANMVYMLTGEGESRSKWQYTGEGREEVDPEHEDDN